LIDLVSALTRGLEQLDGIAIGIFQLDFSVAQADFDLIAES